MKPFDHTRLARHLLAILLYLLGAAVGLRLAFSREATMHFWTDTVPRLGAGLLAAFIVGASAKLVEPPR